MGKKAGERLERFGRFALGVGTLGLSEGIISVVENQQEQKKLARETRREQQRAAAAASEMEAKMAADKAEADAQAKLTEERNSVRRRQRMRRGFSPGREGTILTDLGGGAGGMGGQESGGKTLLGV